MDIFLFLNNWDDWLPCGNCGKLDLAVRSVMKLNLNMKPGLSRQPCFLAGLTAFTLSNAFAQMALVTSSSEFTWTRNVTFDEHCRLPAGIFGLPLLAVTVNMETWPRWFNYFSGICILGQALSCGHSSTTPTGYICSLDQEYCFPAPHWLLVLN